VSTKVGSGVGGLLDGDGISIEIGEEAGSRVLGVALTIGVGISVAEGEGVAVPLPQAAATN